MAAELARAMLQDTIAVARSVIGAELVLSVTEAFAFEPADVCQWVQPEGDLGARLEQTLQRALEMAPCALAVGADSPGMSSAMLDEALALLNSHTAVFGAADDGGFYSLGLRSCPTGLLAGIRWSHPETLNDAVAGVQAAGMNVGFGPRWFDLDTASDLRRVCRLLDTGAIMAPNVQKVVSAWRSGRT